MNNDESSFSRIVSFMRNIWVIQGVMRQFKCHAFLSQHGTGCIYLFPSCCMHMNDRLQTWDIQTWTNLNYHYFYLLFLITCTVLNCLNTIERHRSMNEWIHEMHWIELRCIALHRIASHRIASHLSRVLILSIFPSLSLQPTSECISLVSGLWWG